MYDRELLKQLIRQYALQFGTFTLASGKTASYYLDCRKLTLSSDGAVQIGAGILELLQNKLPDAVGGMAIGADPITAATITIAGLQGKSLKGFIVRKEAKAHGTGRDVEGPVVPGEKVVIVEDVVTTGGSSLKAIEKVKAFGLEVVEVISIIDRLEGGAATFAAEGIPYRSLFTIRDFGIGT